VTLSRRPPKTELFNSVGPGKTSQGDTLRSSPDELYRTVLADLYRKKDEITAAIAALEQFLSPASHADVMSGAPASLTQQLLNAPTNSVVSNGVLAALRALGGSGRNADIKRVMLQSGFRFKGDPIVSISQCLSRLAALDQVERIQRGSWRLKS
jgi:hypothetical protein